MTLNVINNKNKNKIHDWSLFRVCSLIEQGFFSLVCGHGCLGSIGFYLSGPNAKLKLSNVKLWFKDVAILNVYLPYIIPQSQDPVKSHTLLIYEQWTPKQTIGNTSTYFLRRIYLIVHNHGACIYIVNLIIVCSVWSYQ